MGGCTNILADIQNIISSLFDFKINFLKNTGFDTVPGSTMKHAFLGFILAAASNVTKIADISGLIKFEEEPPFIGFHFDAIKLDVEFFKKIYQGFKDYIIFMKNVVEKKFPAILKKVEKFPENCDKIKDSAKGEIDGLDFMAKGKAVVAMALCIKMLLNVPAIFKSIFETLEKRFYGN